MNERRPSAARISPAKNTFYSCVDTLHNRKKPGVTYCVHTDYMQGTTGDYTFFISEEVTSFPEVAQNLTSLTVPFQWHIKLTNGPGKMPEICINAWQQIWVMNSSQPGGERAFIADFQVYNKHLNIAGDRMPDIYIGIKGEA